jgi:hypothetical protein
LRRTAALAALAIGLTAPATAAAEELPSGKFGVVAGLRQGIGRLSDNFGVGYLWGVQAGWQPTRTASPWSLGAEWSWLRGNLGADDPATIDGGLSIIEMSLGLRVRRLFGQGAPQFLVLGAGGSILRTNIPIPPDTERTYAGAYLSAGFELYVGGTYLVTLEARYGLIAGPGSLSALASFSFGK